MNIQEFCKQSREEIESQFHRYFNNSEIIPPESMDEGIEKFPSESLGMIILLREDYNESIYINYSGLHYCGFRPSSYKGGATFSMHRKYCAYDLHAKDLHSLIALVRKNWKKYGITRIENPEKTKNWLHIDNRKTGLDKLVEFDP